MTFEEIWQKHVDKKPLLADPNSTVEIKTEQFKRLLRIFYEEGIEQGRNEPSIFDNIFGFGRKT